MKQKFKDNKLDFDGFVAMVTQLDASIADTAREIGKGCADVTDGDRCEAALKVCHCVHEAAAAKGITPENF